MFVSPLSHRQRVQGHFLQTCPSAKEVRSGFAQLSRVLLYIIAWLRMTTVESGDILWQH